MRFDGGVLSRRAFESGINFAGAEQGIVIRKLGSIEPETCYITYMVVILF